MAPTAETKLRVSTLSPMWVSRFSEVGANDWKVNYSRDLVGLNNRTPLKCGNVTPNPGIRLASRVLEEDRDRIGS